MEELVNQTNYGRVAKILYIFGIILYLISLMVGVYFLFFSIAFSSGCCLHIISYQFRNIVISTISFIIIVPFLKKRNYLFTIPIIFALIFFNNIYIYITSETAFYPYLQILYYNVGFYVGLLLLWISNGLYFQNNTKRSKLIIPVLIVLGVITFLLIPSVKPYYWNMRNSAFEKKAYNSMKDIYIPNGLNLPSPEINYPDSDSMGNTRGGYSITMDVTECPKFNEEWRNSLIKNSWSYSDYYSFTESGASVMMTENIYEQVFHKNQWNNSEFGNLSELRYSCTKKDGKGIKFYIFVNF